MHPLLVTATKEREISRDRYVDYVLIIPCEKYVYIMHHRHSFNDLVIDRPNQNCAIIFSVIGA